MKLKYALVNFITLILIGLLLLGCGGAAEVIEDPTPAAILSTKISNKFVLQDAYINALNQMGENIRPQTIIEVEKTLNDTNAIGSSNIFTLVQQDPNQVAQSLNINEEKLEEATTLVFISALQEAGELDIISDEEKELLLTHDLTSQYIDYSNILGQVLGIPSEQVYDIYTNDHALIDYIIEQGQDPQQIYSQVNEKFVARALELAGDYSVDIFDFENSNYCLSGFESLIETTNPLDVPNDTINLVENNYQIYLQYNEPCFGFLQVGDEPLPPDQDVCLDCEYVGPGSGPPGISLGIGKPTSDLAVPTFRKPTANNRCQKTEKSDPHQHMIEILSSSDKTGLKNKINTCANMQYPKMIVDVTSGIFTDIYFYYEKNGICGKQFDEPSLKTIKKINSNQLVLYCGDPIAVYGTPPDTKYEAYTYNINYRGN